MFKIFYGDSILYFAGESPGGFPEGRVIPAGESFANIIENLEKYKHICVTSSNPVAERQKFVSNFRLVDAAGGVVSSTVGKLLMIYRNGRWDLPKGHREPGENTRHCAARETEEETGVRTVGFETAQAVINTWHFYRIDGTWEMKRTYWYSLQAAESVVPKPQIAEGITSVEWVSRREMATRAATSFPSVAEVLWQAGWLDVKKC